MWISRHLYCGRHPYDREVDRVLVDLVDPLVRELRRDGLVRRFFFIRYSEGGPHVRLRLLPASTRADARAGGEVAREIAERVRAASAACPRVRDLRDVPYEPELERYGGVEAMDSAEALFGLSSELALELLAAESATDETGHESVVEARLGKSLLLAVVLGRAFFERPEAVRSFLRGYALSYLKIACRDADDPEAMRRRLLPENGVDPAASRAVLELLTAQDPADDPAAPVFHVPLLDRWYRGCRATARSLAGARSLAEPGDEAWDPWSRLRALSSHLHVHHNRLGWSIPQEVHLTHLAATQLDAAVHLGAPA